MGTTDLLCQSLQKQSQDVVNAMLLVRSTKALIQDLRENGWDKLFANVVPFCEKHGIEIPDLNDCHSTTRFGRSRLEENQDGYKAFDVDTICTLVQKYYPMDFSDHEKMKLPFDLRHFLFDVRQSSTFKNLSTIQELCSCLAATGQNKEYFLIDKLLRLIMTLPVSTATTERYFSAMKIIKSKLRNKMGPGYLADSMSVYIEREISASISSESIIDDFKSLGKRKMSL
ncbi:uncharacterized protein [Medicago truncatula]|uniref:uncharacterized protein n=1 Tax=Medicago truncatula TaxID=3880 RepID=UPI000D2F2D5E|nr:uncharacterized protein LOC112422653 [Medicago truncatula]